LLELEERIGHVKKGLTQEEIETIPTTLISSTQELNQKQCAICTEVFTEQTYVKRLQCKHDYHDECINKWLLSSKKCPLCQTEVQVRFPGDDEMEVYDY